jgi:hypothetical protein
LIAEATSARNCGSADRIASAPVNSSRFAERELGPCSRRRPSGSSTSAPLKNISARKSFIGCMMAMFSPSRE